jgi:hypothetical protein
MWIDNTTKESLYNCAECEATWQTVEKIGSEDNSQFNRPFDGSMVDFEQVKTYD